ncbi:MAG: formyltransferase family protein [Flavobacteriales bacterium]
MKVAVLTSTYQGFASVIIPKLIEKGVEVDQVIFCEGIDGKKKGGWKRKWRKVRKIGPLGALNGIRMRKWYDREPYRILEPKSLPQLSKEYAFALHRTPTAGSERTRELLEDAEAPVFLSLGNGYIPERIFSIPEDGMLNIHHEILPDFQGAQSVIWQLYEGNAETGFTIHFVDKRIDQGRILYQERFPIEFRSRLRDTVVHNYTRSIERSGRALGKVLEDWKGYKAQAWEQGKGKKYTTPTFGEFRRILREHEERAKD